MAFSPQDFLDTVPYAQALSIRFDGVEDDRVRLSMPWDARLVGDPASNVMHGGPVFALLDMALGLASVQTRGSMGLTATLGMRVDYMRPATPGQRIHAEAFCYRMTRTVAFVRGQATDADSGRPIAMASGTFTNDGRRGKEAS